jgi:anaerobic selenocysteine-containing dehydrogenase
MIATIQDGRVTRLQGDPDHPVTQGFLCRRTSRFLDRQYSKDRLLKPLLRRGDAFVEIDWAAALDLIAEKMLQFRNESGAASILNYRCGGSLGIMKHVGDYFFQRFGPVTIKSGDICSGAGEAAQETDFGICDSHDLFDLKNSRTIFLWGKNVFVSSVHLIPLLKEARNQGTRIILIDPVHHQTASLADLHVQPRAGSDAAIALGIARQLFEEKQFDHSAPDYCDHFESFRALSFSRGLDQWAALASISVTELKQLADEYQRSPASILVGWGMQRRRFGATTIRAIDALAAISGNLGVAGGGVSFYFARRSAFDFSFANKAEPARTIPEPLLGRRILESADPPIRMAYISSANPVAMLPDSKIVAEALSTREFTVVVDSFMTDSARCASLILPTTTMLEEDDLLGSYGHHFLSEMQAVVEPPPGILSDYQILQQLANRVGLQADFADDVDVWKQRLLGRVAEKGVTLADFRQGTVKNPFAVPVLFADRKFPTATGRVNLLKQLPSDMLAEWEKCERNPRLRLAALSTSKAQASQWPDGSQTGPADAIIHPEAARGFADGEIALLKSDQDSLQVRLRFDRQQRTDIVLLEKGGWLHANRCANALVPAVLTDAGECAVYYDTAVEICRPDLS